MYQKKDKEGASSSKSPEIEATDDATLFALDDEDEDDQQGESSRKKKGKGGEEEEGLLG